MGRGTRINNKKRTIKVLSSTVALGLLGGWLAPNLYDGRRNGVVATRTKEPTETRKDEGYGPNAPFSRISRVEIVSRFSGVESEKENTRAIMGGRR